ncbi:MAG: Cyanophycin synthetase [Parcubacteria group bacterium GW2011_GWC2_39_14]|nr:MAG: Cyanophycin synthetase [Parcubacteria group bacterium GW2011_GWC2_39_14]KKR55262.1 MAG: Cyanophycin synthetase [Parcubacteria group bacterium GW2011_GWA2_40_23]
MEKGNKYCHDCGQPKVEHINTWMEELLGRVLPSLKLPKKLEEISDIIIEKIFTLSKLARFTTDFTSADIQLRSSCFMAEMRPRGAVFYATKTSYGFTNYFKMEVADKIFRFETLPLAKFESKYPAKLVDDKELAKRHCQNGGFPIAEGRVFWFWQKKKAMEFARQVGFPLVVKPRSGSVSRHVTTNIQNDEQLEKAIRHSISYSPSFIIERFMADTSVYRATVIDFDFVACIKQVPANIVGDGISTIRELINQKNNDSRRGDPKQKQLTLYKLVENETTQKLLDEKMYDDGTILAKDESFFLQNNPFLKLGGDLVEVTPIVHPDNLQLFRDLARHFDIRLTGIDFLVNDISVSWKDQPCAILELNSAPCIELHHYPSSGEPTNPAGALADMFFKYYL